MNLWRFINPIVVFVAKSPLHFFVSHQILIISFKGVKSNKQYHVPVSYHKHSSSFTCVTLRSNIWWRNLKNLHNVDIWLKGKLTNTEINLEYLDDAKVEAALRDLVTNNPIDAFFAKVKLNKDGSPDTMELQAAAKLHTVLKFSLHT